MRTLVAIPVFNEEAYLPRVLPTVQEHTGDILVIDDGSTDNTPEILSRFQNISVLRHGTNCGYGQSLIDAFAFAAAHRYDWVITLDCDEQHEAGFIPTFIKEAARDDADIISGSRYLSQLPDNTAAPADRRRINSVVTDIINSVLGLRLTDSFCGFKAHRVSAMQRLQLTTVGYAFPLEFWVEAVKSELRVREIAVPLIYNDPNRHFGGSLDEPDTRLRHYLDVLCDSLKRANIVPPQGCPESIRNV